MSLLGEFNGAFNTGLVLIILSKRESLRRDAAATRRGGNFETLKALFEISTPCGLDNLFIR